MTNPPNPEVAILNAALELRPAERTAYLDQACAGDAALRRQVEALLQAHAHAEGFLDAPPAGLDFKRTVKLNVPLTEKPGDKIGRYKLLQQIGEGGCGVVYMAEQEEPVRRRVALKVIKLGMDTKQVIARFEAERQALALMDHPNIAKIFDAGITDAPLPASGHPLPSSDEGRGQGEGSPPVTRHSPLATHYGRPYFVMELVRGIKITDFCDENKLSTADRLKLFIQVCQAIQHAHQKGVIHRDIKPSNILVTVNDGVPVPKVIDFGIAKATQGRLTDHTLFTAFEQFIGTPAYMSPEQAVMTSLDIDTRSDIYSLGVLLYELLTGRTPFDQKELLAAGLDEMRRTIREEEPPRPSTRLSTMAAEALTLTANQHHTDAPKLMHAVRGDLDWIVMKCLEKNRVRRYETANGVAMDITRHLNCEPVVARPPSRFYEFQKTVRRHKFGFAAAAALITVLSAGVVMSTSEAIRATHAQREQARQCQIAETKEKKSEQVAQFLKDMLQGVAPSVALGRDTTMLREIVDKTAERVGADLKDQPEVEIEMRLTLAKVYFDLQLYQKMETMSREALRLARAHFGEENLFVADALGQIGRALFFRRSLDESEDFTRQAIAMQKKLRGEDSLEEAASLCNLSDVLRRKGKLDEAETAIRAGLRILKKRLGNDSSEVVWGLNTEAEDVIREALATGPRSASGKDDPATASAYLELGVTIKDGSTNRFSEAETYIRKALEIQEKIQGKGKVSQQHSHFALADALKKQGKLDEAEIHYREALTIAGREMGADFPELPEYVAALAGILREQGKLAEAKALLEGQTNTPAEKKPEPH
jgi:serine/threonine protein kinase/tetratricopeptide (TPR) repeat protein